MLKKVVIIFILLALAFQGSAFAVIETQGDVVFRDALYGAAIGALLGTAFYLADQDQFTQKIAIGVAVGTIGGLVFGVMETRSSMVEIDKDGVKLAVPTPIIYQNGNETVYSTSLFRMELD
ncbi:MAG: hypothetical protein JSV21_02110 [Nitrospirota bacterium]|nr:MAG: hypothetical protein JSV21_02110 [Nitrospirota bacterium]